jgi:hypothetical protein
MSLPSVRKELHLDDTTRQADWPGLIKTKVMNLALGESVDGLPVASNGAAKLCNKRATKKRDNIHGDDPLQQTVCIQAPLQLRLEECQLTIVLAPRCLYVAGINVVTGKLFLNQHCHVTIFGFLGFFLIKYCHIKIIIFNFDTESSCSWNKRGTFSELILNPAGAVFLAKY